MQKNQTCVNFRLGANTDSCLQKFFEKWGTFCAERPWLVLFFGSCAIVALGHGIKYLKVPYFVYTLNTALYFKLKKFLDGLQVYIKIVLESPE